jgi:hypothetical protein
LRRAVGREGVTALAEHEQTIGALANSNQLAHTRLDGTDTAFAVVCQEVKMLREHYTEHQRRLVTFWGRLRWLVTGR